MELSIGVTIPMYHLQLMWANVVPYLLMVARSRHASSGRVSKSTLMLRLSIGQRVSDSKR